MEIHSLLQIRFQARLSQFEAGQRLHFIKISLSVVLKKTDNWEYNIEMNINRRTLSTIGSFNDNVKGWLIRQELWDTRYFVYSSRVCTLIMQEKMSLEIRIYLLCPLSPPHPTFLIPLSWFAKSLQECKRFA